MKQKDQHYFSLTFGPKKAVQNTAAFTSDYYFLRWDGVDLSYFLNKDDISLQQRSSVLDHTRK